MTLICFASQKGSPGTTATALAVAAALPVSGGRRKLLVEADASGGTLAIRYRLPVEPGLLTLAAAVRGEIDAVGLWRHTQELPGGLAVVLCPDGSDQVHAALAASGPRLGRFLSGLGDVDVICDVGRLLPDSPSLGFVAEAGAVLMVARPMAEQLQPAARRMAALRPGVANLGWVLIGEKPYGAAEVEATYDFPVVGLIADDARSVASLENGMMSKRLRRHPFVRSSVTLARTLADWAAPAGEAPPGNQVGPEQESVEPQPADIDHRWLGGPESWRPPQRPGRPRSSRNGSGHREAVRPDGARRPPPGFRTGSVGSADPAGSAGAAGPEQEPTTAPVDHDRSTPEVAPVWDPPRPPKPRAAIAEPNPPLPEPGHRLPDPPAPPPSPFPQEETETDRVAR